MANTQVTGDLIANGAITAAKLSNVTTDTISEGTALYYTDSRVASYLSANSYATEGYVTTAVNNLIDAAPASLDTLNKLAAALNDDANFATTVTNALATKLNLSGGNITGNLSVDTNVLFVDTVNDRVGIGTSSPSAVLTSNNTGTLTLDSNDNDHTGFGLFIKSVNTPNTVNSAIGFGGVAGRKYAAIGAQTYGDSDQVGLNFYVQETASGSSASLGEAMRITSGGALCVGTTGSGTFSGDGVIAFGGGGGIIAKNGTIAASATLDININTGGGGYQGFLIVSNTVSASANIRTHKTFSVFGRGTDSSIQQIATDNGVSGGASFTVTTPSNGVIRVTNTSVFSCFVVIQFFGGISL